MYCVSAVLKKKVTHVHQHTFIKEHFLGFGKDSIVLGWLVSCYFIYGLRYNIFAFTSTTIELNEKGLILYCSFSFLPTCFPCLSCVRIGMKYACNRKGRSWNCFIYEKYAHVCPWPRFWFCGWSWSLSWWSYDSYFC